MLNNDYNNRVISEEIKNLFNDLDRIVENKRLLTKNFKELYLNLSNNN